ncbi:MAG: hypothetical protein D6695_02150 [Planctomycetota bacterium]|nr:MAG: hypothetical protein D6695_02150 [Planctomycetota bacterium]
MLSAAGKKTARVIRLRTLSFVDTHSLISWSALLARWTEFAQSALALPQNEEGNRWRDAVPHVISLQAITHALAELPTVDHAEIPLALDRAEIAIRDAASGLDRIWSGLALPTEALELLEDARLALRSARTIGWAWTIRSESLVASHPADLAAVLAESGLVRTLLLPTPGIALFKTSPAAHLVPTDWSASIEPVCEAVSAFLDAGGSCELIGLDVRRQVYRQFDFARGGPVRDLVLPTEAGLAPGQPLLVPAIAEAELQPVTLPPRGPVQLDPLPVEHADTPAEQ